MSKLKAKPYDRGCRMKVLYISFALAYKIILQLVGGV